MRTNLMLLPGLLPVHHGFPLIQVSWLIKVTPEYNRQNPREEPLVDPSSDLIEVTLLLSTWYRLFRRCDPPKDADDLKDYLEIGV